MVFENSSSCETTVSLLRALTLGSGESCISMDLWSVATLLVPFVCGVVVLQYIARRLLGYGKTRKPVLAEKPTETYASPIESTGAWRDSGGLK